jgi:hypothetical protein
MTGKLARIEEPARSEARCGRARASSLERNDRITVCNSVRCFPDLSCAALTWTPARWLVRRITRGQMTVPNGSVAAGRKEKSGAFAIRARAPRPGREERLSATKNRVRCPNGSLVNVRLTRTEIWRLAESDLATAVFGAVPECRRAGAARPSGPSDLATEPEEVALTVSDRPDMAWHDEALRQRAGATRRSGQHRGMRTREVRSGSRVA